MTAQRPWQLEDLFRPGAMGAAVADAKFNGNASAQRAIDDFRRAIRDLRDYLRDNPPDLPNDVAATLGIKQANER